MDIKKGVTRIVILYDKYAIKIPNFKYSMYNFLSGCLSNWKEREYYNKFHSLDIENNLVDYVSPSLFCSWFGLVQIQYRCKPLDRDLTENEKEFFFPLCGTDNKKENFGLLNGKLVCIDYN